MISKLVSLCKYVFLRGKNLRWQGAGMVAVLLAAFVYALLATYGERSGLREAFVSLLILNVLVILGLLLWGKLHDVLKKDAPSTTGTEEDLFAKLDRMRGLFTIFAIIDFLNIAGWIVVPTAVLTVLWYTFGLG